MRFRRILCAVLLLVLVAAVLPLPGETALAAVSNALGGKDPRKVIVVKGRLVNIVL